MELTRARQEREIEEAARAEMREKEIKGRRERKPEVEIDDDDMRWRL